MRLQVYPGFVLQRHKHGRLCVLAKVVKARPTGEIVVAMPVRRRRFATPSLPAEALQLARSAGATAWVVRFDSDRRCYRVPLNIVEIVGKVGRDGEIEVPMRCFTPCQWLDWDYVEHAIII